MKDAITKISTFELFDRELTKKEQRKLQMVEAAVLLFSQKGFDGISFETIAKKCKVTRTLVNHYFKDMDEVFTLATTFVRVRYQKSVVAKIKLDGKPEEALRSYIQAALDWYNDQPAHFQLWMLYYHRASTDQRSGREHTELVDLGTERIMGMLLKLPHNERKPAHDLHLLARSIQIVVTGTLVTLASEARDPSAQRKLQEQGRKMCYLLAGL